MKRPHWRNDTAINFVPDVLFRGQQNHPLKGKFHHAQNRTTSQQQYRITLMSICEAFSLESRCRNYIELCVMLAEGLYTILIDYQTR